MADNFSHLYAVIQPLNRPYFTKNPIIRTTTVALRDPFVLNQHLDNGFIYIRRLNYNYHHILREPTNGSYVELTKIQDLGSFLLDSPKARKLIRKISYF